MQKQVPLQNKEMILYLLNLIRYDIPILMSGKSSIGKSYTILGMAKQWGMPNAVLYVGSEKADNIEGLPKLIQSEESQKESEGVLEYFKPYWFPKTDLIQKAVQSGQNIFDEKIKPYLVGTDAQNLPYQTVMGLLWAISTMGFEGDKTTQSFDFIDTTKYITPDSDKVLLVSKPVELTRVLIPKGEEALNYKNELYELSLYLCTLVGLGNYWLILDELDKVQDEEADKFAPMLHIVRERRLKTYSLREFNDGEGSDVAMNVVGNSYLKIYNEIKNSLANNLSVLDTRIIGISNQTANIIRISDALFKRFVQVVISDIIQLKPVSKKLENIRTCLLPIQTSIENQQGALDLGYLEEINLQWQYNFLPRILNTGDSAGNFIRLNYEDETAVAMNIPDADLREARLKELRQKTALYKLCVDNFDEDEKVNVSLNPDVEEKVAVPELVMDCLAGQIVPVPDTQKEGVITSNPMDLINQFKGEGYDDKDTAFKIYDVLMEKYETLPTTESRRLEMEKLVDYAFSFISHTAYADGYTDQKVKEGIAYSPLEINKYLIPLMIKFTLKIVTKDDELSPSKHINFDDKDKLLSRHAELWDKFAIPEHIDKIKGDPDLTNKLFYGGEDSLWGSSDLNADDFQKSFVNAYNSANIGLFDEFIKAYLEMDAEKKTEFSDFIEYIKKYRLDEVRDLKRRTIEGLKKQADEYKKVGDSKELSANTQLQISLIKKFRDSFGIA